MNNNKRGFVYIDQNIIQYTYEGELNIKYNEKFDWVYSDEHFIEISRQKNQGFLNVLKNLKARRIEIVSDEKFKLTDQATIDEYRDPFFVFEDYEKRINEIPKMAFNFEPLLAFFAGDPNAIVPEKYVQDFRESIKSLIDPIIGNVDIPNFKDKFNEDLDIISDEFLEMIKNAQSNIMPIEKMRKQISKIQFSDLKKSNGGIINQIWDLIGAKIGSITKAQYFGKERLPFETQEFWPIFLAIVKCHTALNFLGYCPDNNLRKVSKIYNVNSDASHTGHAAYCTAFISADSRLCKKAEAIFDYFKTGTLVHKYELKKQREPA